MYNFVSRVELKGNMAYPYMRGTAAMYIATATSDIIMR